MGIKNLMSIIKVLSPKSIKGTNILDYTDKILAFDTNLLIYKNIMAIRKNGADIKNKKIIVTHIVSMILKLSALKKYKIKAIFVFDGQMPNMKNNTMKKRKEIIKSYKKRYDEAKTDDERKQYFYMKSDVMYQEIKDCMELIKIYGFPIIQSIGEADKVLAGLSKANKNIVIVSEDMDILLHGSRNLLRHFSVDQKKTMCEINTKRVLKDMKFNQRMLIDLGILLGCDYCDKIAGIGPVTALKYIKKHRYINVLVKKEIIEFNNYDVLYDYFRTDKIRYRYVEHNLNKVNLVRFLKRFKFKQKYIDKKVNKVSI